MRLLAALEAQEWLERALLGKAAKKRSILTDAGFLRAALRVARKLVQEVHLALGSKEFVARLRRSSGIDWLGATAAEKTTAVAELGNLIEGLPSSFAPGVKVVLDEEGKAVLGETHKDLGKKHKEFRVDPSFEVKNERAIDALSSSNVVFFAEEYEKRAASFRDRAQKVIADGLEKGLGRSEIASDLRDQFKGAAIAESYWETAAAVHVSRARSFSAAATYAEAGVEKFQIVAIVDERTTPLCAALNGMVFSVKKALDHFDALEGAKSLDEVKERLSPFGRVSEGGGFELSSGAMLSPKATPEEFQAAGLHMPPFHYRCRSTVVPEF